ncbi:serine/threonine-protein kinase [Cellulomonas sp. URHD0024]|uniref:serine/threonine-protein kinase n=1 Tax=Cellulomonas sp. URHD0024 TaxID=1302620 RepID=UPI0012DF7041|nr:serine/threonine-protein kinase [Cellulomonas sp. URHD0024]
MSERVGAVHAADGLRVGRDGEQVLGGRYRLDGLIGRGGMATVYRASDLLLDRQVAVKLFPPVSDDADDLLRGSAEIRILATLSHPGLVALYDAGSVHDADGYRQLYLVMELVDGPNLADHLLGGPLSVEDTALVGLRVAAALEVVHGQEIVHRDIKPGNILLAAPGDDRDTAPAERIVKVADFGIARLSGATRLTMTGVTLGTVRYVSPEQASGGPVGPSSDVYSLGLVLIECLAGRAAFDGTLAEVAAMRLTSPPTIPPGTRSDLAQLLTRMTAIAPAERPDASEVKVAMAEVLATTAVPGIADTIALPQVGRPVPTVPEDSERRGPHARRRLRLLTGGAVAVVVLALATVVGVHLGDRATPTAPPSYPAVQGELGDALTSLQQSVNP